MQSLGVEQLLLIGAGLVTAVSHRQHEGAVDALPEPDRGTVRVLLRDQRIALVLLLVVVPLEIARARLLSGSVAASAVPAAIGMVAALYLWRVRRHAYRIYELGTEDGKVEQVRRARDLQRHALVSFCASAVLWGGLLLYKISR